MDQDKNVLGYSHNLGLPKKLIIFKISLKTIPQEKAKNINNILEMLIFDNVWERLSVPYPYQIKRYRISYKLEKNIYSNGCCNKKCFSLKVVKYFKFLAPWLFK